jgi:hypothetical protein
MSFQPPYTPQENGVAERKNRTLIEMSRTMLDGYKSPRSPHPLRLSQPGGIGTLGYPELDSPIAACS